MPVTILRKVTVSGGTVLRAANNLGDVADAATSRTNLGLGTGSSPQFSSVGVGGAAPGSNGLKIFGTTASTSTTTGALQVAGGAGVAGRVYAAAFFPTSGAPVSGSIGLSSSNGLELWGSTGTNFDWRVYTAAGNAFLGNPTGTNNLTIAGNLTVSGTGASTFAGSAKVGASGSADSRLHVYESATVGTGNGLTVEQAGTGDAVTQYLLTGVQRWSTGIDNSDSDAFVISAGALGTNNVLRATTGGDVSLTGNLTVSGTGTSTFAGPISTSAPTGGAGAWELGVANAVTPTSPNRTITIEIGGTVYYLHAKTTND